MKCTSIVATLFLLVAALTPVHAAIIPIVNETFDTYADTAAMKAVWGGTGNLGTLDTTLSYSPNNSAAHPGGTVNIYQPGIGTVTPTATKDLVLSAKIYDNALVANDRITVGLRTGANPLFEMGRYNDWTPLPASPVHTYGIRAVSLGNGITPSPGWRPFLIGGNPIPANQGWHSYEATFSIASGLTVTLDLDSDGTIDSTLQFAGNGTSQFGNFTDLRFGGPSNLSSAGGGANFDDIRLALVPEPASMMMAGLMGLGLACLRPRR
jgi:hypothetical protein